MIENNGEGLVLGAQRERMGVNMRTPVLIRRRVFAAVVHALREHYGENYSIRCAQASQAVADILERSGIRATPVFGEACVAQVFGSGVAWMSFGGGYSQDRRPAHCWVMTRSELVDLTIWQHHRAPGAQQGGFPGPALWFDEPANLPPCHKYLPGDRQGRSVGFVEADENERFRRFLISANDNFDRFDEGAMPALPFHIIGNWSDLERIRNEGDPWMNGLLASRLPAPPSWAQRREAELLRRQ